MKRSRVLLTLALVSLLSLPTTAKSSTFKVLHSFGGQNDGAYPSGPLFVDSQGNLYGVTGGGPGEYGYGVVFELIPEINGTWTESVLHSFSAGNDGAQPRGELVSDQVGNLYGSLGGDGGLGGIFELTPNNGSWNNTLIYSDYAAPGLLIDNIGNLYGEIGTGQSHAGALGELSPGSGGWLYTELYNFCSHYGCPDGYTLPAPPIWDGKGNMYGVTTDGGIDRPPCFSTNGCGVIFRMVPNSESTWTYQVLHRFASSPIAPSPMDGEWPYGSLVMDAAGNFYGSTWLGGKYNHGTVFKFQSNGRDVWEETPIYDFPNCLQGCMVEGTLAMDQAGNLYGTAAGGTGSCGGAACGVIFELSPQPNGQWKYTVLHYLDSSDGGVQPFYGVILDDKGDLFGVTSGFGEYGGGTAFEITP
jgi:uncharacterized repeat protein (TIGR03803 family)